MQTLLTGVIFIYAALLIINKSGKGKGVGENVEGTEEGFIPYVYERIVSHIHSMHIKERIEVIVKDSLDISFYVTF